MPRFLPQLTGLKYILAFTALFFSFVFSSSCLAESAVTSEWNIAADKMTRIEEPESIIAEGNVVFTKRIKLPPKPLKKETSALNWSELLEEEVVEVEATPEELQKDQKPRFVTEAVIKSDWVAYDVAKQSIRARGNVSIENGEDQVFAEEAQIDLNTQTGSFTEAKIIRKDHNLHLEGKDIVKTGIKTYRIIDGWVITCKLEEGEVPPWSFSSSDTTIERDGYAVLKHAKFKIRNIPVFYTPYMVIPAKDTRQTGLLFPEISTSTRDGFGLNVPFFLNLSKSSDLTIYPTFYTERGIMPSAEFRYVQSTTNKGTFMGSYLDDTLSDPSETEYYAETNFTHTNNDRYWLRGKLDHDFGNNWIARVDLDVVSDRDYLTEFDSGLTGFNKSQSKFLNTYGRGFENKDEDQRSNTLRILKSWSGMSLNMSLLAVDDVRKAEVPSTSPTATARPTPLFKLPSVDYTGAIPIGNTALSFDWDADYVNYWREEGIGGHRIDLYPRLSTPLPLGSYLESRAEIGLRETLYSVTTNGDATWTKDDTPNRFLYTVHTDLATTLVRNYDFGDNSNKVLAHKIRPYVEYDYIPEEDQSDNPYFDKVDLIEDANKITYGLDTFFNLYNGKDSNTLRHLRQYSFIKISQSYDLRNESSDKPLSPISVKLGWKPMSMMNIVYKTEIPIEDEDYTIHGFEGEFTNSRGDGFALDYRYNEEEDIEQLNAHIRLQLLSYLTGEFKIEHSLAEDETNEGSLSLTYLAQCWSVQLKGKYTPTDEQILLIFNLANIGSPLGISL